jgi:glutamate racemase
LINDIVGSQVRVIDPAPAVARQTGRVAGLTAQDGPAGECRLVTSGDPAALQALLPLLLGESLPVTPLDWVDDQLVERG